MDVVMFVLLEIAQLYQVLLTPSTHFRDNRSPVF